MSKVDILGDALAKKGGLTLSQLVDYDDRLTDSLVDRIYYWSTIRKLRPGYHPARGVREEELCKLLQRHVILDKDPVTAVRKILDLPAFGKYLMSLKTKDEREQFQRHLSKYVRIYMPDCPFEVCTTHRYTLTTLEACIIARKPIAKGEVIKYLTGIQVAMNKKEESELGVSNRDFSVVMSSRRKVPSLFLGPARFANHDCNANARLSTTGPHSMQIVSIRNIAVDEEVTVQYGDNYFGINNRECLCATCEVLWRNGWRQKRRGQTQAEQKEVITKVAMLTPDPEPPLAVSGSDVSKDPIDIQRPGLRRSLRRKRKFSVDADTHSIVYDEQSEICFPASKRQRLTEASSQEGPRTSSRRRTIGKLNVDKQTMNETDGPQRKSRKRETQSLTTRKLQSLRKHAETSSSSQSTSRTASLPRVLQISRHDCSGDRTDPSKAPTDRPSEGLAPTRRSLRLRSPSELAIGLSTPVDSVLDDGSAENPDSEDDVLTANKVLRTPGDHVGTTLQLTTINSRWIACQQCDGVFVQHDAYLTRAYCPRCERHSKLYGFAWPKTDREGKHDTEERILDHRVIHKFLSHEEEAKERKGRTKGVIVELRKSFGDPSARIDDF